MKSYRLIIASLSACALVMSFPTFAQERTIGAAHDFLAKTWRERLDGFKINFFRIDEADAANLSIVGIDGYARLSDCASRFVGKSSDGQRQSADVNWRLASEVNVAGKSNNFVRIYGGAKGYRLIGVTAASEADATRIANAFQYLLDNCRENSPF